jgi:formylglycine-generating enzyme required for sulfatase activity
MRFGAIAVLLVAACGAEDPTLEGGSPRAATCFTASAPPAQAPIPSFCSEDMVEIEGEYCTVLSQKCLRKRKPWQCAEFEKESVCEGAVLHKRYCIDRYEWPNRKGAMPAVMNSWYDARRLCESAGKRLCTMAEWTLACEGPDRLPFPYGHVRDPAMCNFDKPSPMQDEYRLFNPSTQEAELARLDQREPSGHRETCKSPYGVYDMTGSVDEFVLNEYGVPYKSALKGGNWGEYRNACRPATLGHDEGFRYYQTGFRCCKDAR